LNRIDLSFKDDEVQLPVLSDGEDVPFSIQFTGHFPDLDTFTNEDKDRLSVFYDRGDLQTYLLQKNEFEDRNKYYVKVTDVKSLKPCGWVQDGILNFIWNQFIASSTGLNKKGSYVLPSFLFCFYKFGGF
jgi:hypothetical protein